MNAQVSCPGRGRQEGWEAASKPLSSVYCAFVPRRSWGLPRPPQPQVRRPGRSGFERAWPCSKCYGPLVQFLMLW